MANKGASARKGENHANGVNSNRGIWALYSDAAEVIGRLREIELARHGLTPEQSRVLHVLRDNGGSGTISQLAIAAVRRHNTMSGIVQRMEKKGMVVIGKTDDNRQYLVSITDEGRDCSDKLPARSIDLVFSSLNEDEKKALVSIVTKLGKRGREVLGIDHRLGI